MPHTGMGRLGVGQGLESDRNRPSLKLGRMSAIAQTSRDCERSAMLTGKGVTALLVSPNPVFQVPKPAPRWTEGTFPQSSSGEEQMAYPVPSYLFLVRDGGGGALLVFGLGIS